MSLVRSPALLDADDEELLGPVAPEEELQASKPAEVDVSACKLVASRGYIPHAELLELLVFLLCELDELEPPMLIKPPSGEDDVEVVDPVFEV